MNHIIPENHKLVWLAVNRDTGRLEMQDESLETLISLVETWGLKGGVYFTKGFIPNDESAY